MGSAHAELLTPDDDVASVLELECPGVEGADDLFADDTDLLDGREHGNGLMGYVNSVCIPNKYEEWWLSAGLL